LGLVGAAKNTNVNLNPLLYAMEKAEETEDKRGLGPLNVTFQEWMDADMPTGKYRDCENQEYSQRVVLHYWWHKGGESRYTDWEGLARKHHRFNSDEYWRKVRNALRKDKVLSYLYKLDLDKK
jgi:hypothetical protein